MQLNRPARLRAFATLALSLLGALSGFVSASSPLHAQSAPSGRVSFATRTAAALTSADDAGPIPSSQRLSLTLTLAPDPARAAALDQFLTDVATPSSPSYRHWLTPQQFAASFGAAPAQLAAATAWAEANNLSVDAVSPSATRITVSGFASQVEFAFAVSLHTYNLKGSLAFANQAQPSLPAEAAALFSSIDGLDDLTPVQLSVSSLAAAIDANAAPILALDATQAAGTLSASQLSAYTALFRQAAAQGITTIVARSVTSSGFPAGLPDLTAATLAGEPADPDTAPIALRPTWQSAPGLPADSFRHTPDLTVPSLAAFTQAISAIALQTSARLGNIAPILYSLAPTPGLFTQSGAPSAGSWQPATGLGLVDLPALVKAFPHGTGSSALSVTSSISNPVHGQSFILTATINSATGGAVPTGTITFSSTNSSFPNTSIAINPQGVAVSPSFMLPGGSYPITASYSGDASYSAGISTANVTVQAEPAIFTISAPASVTLGSTVTGTVTLTSASGFGSPNATVTVTPSGITSAAPLTQTISTGASTESAQFTFTTNKAGSVSLQASCTSNDQSFTCYTPQTATTNVPLATPAISLSVSPASPTAGTPVTLSAPVSGIAGIPVTGSVQFFDGVNSIGFGSAPNATYSGLLLVGANHPISAVYQGDANYAKATSNIVNTAVGTAATTTTISASAASAAFGQNITLNITVGSKATVNGTLPTGTLTFTGLGIISSAQVSGGAANVTLSNLAVGTYTVTTAYSGDNNYSPSTGNTLVLTVTQSTASLNASISTTSFVTGSSATLTVTVTLPGTAQLPSGSTFIATIVGVTGATYTGSFSINTGGNTGTGAVTIPAPLAGTYALQITCGANSNFTCIPQSLTLSSTAVPPPGNTPDTTLLTISPAVPNGSQPVTLTAAVSAAAAATTANPITGTVKFFDGTTLIGTGIISTVGGNFVATAMAPLTGATTHTLTAVYSGDPVYVTSTSPALAVVTSLSAAITLSANATSGLSGLNVLFTAQLSGTSASGANPTGTVAFYIAGGTPRLLGSSSLSKSSAGVSLATFSTSTLPAGANIIYAVYSGDSNFATVTSSNITVGVADYGLAFLPPAATLSRGQSASVTAALTAIGGFSGTVTLTCTPPPNAEITCSFSPPSLTGGGSTTLIVKTTAPSTRSEQPGPLAALRTLGGISVAALLCIFLPARRRRMPALLLVLFALGLTFNLGCGSSNVTATITDAGSPLGTSNVTIGTASTSGSSTITHNYIFQVTIQ